jgi:proteasome lid subunit RPN8/RPN11
VHAPDPAPLSPRVVGPDLVLASDPADVDGPFPARPHRSSEVTILPWARASMFRLSRDAYPVEACGLLVAREAPPRAPTVVVNVAATPNRTEGDPRDSFRIGARDRWQVGRSLPPDLRIVGSFHSHPDRPPTPSPRDTAALESGEIMVITETSPGRVGATRSFALR